MTSSYIARRPSEYKIELASPSDSAFVNKVINNVDINAINTASVIGNLSDEEGSED